MLADEQPIVEIYVPRGESVGSGYLIAPRLVLTARHVVEAALPGDGPLSPPARRATVEAVRNLADNQPRCRVRQLKRGGNAAFGDAVVVWWSPHLDVALLVAVEDVTPAEYVPDLDADLSSVDPIEVTAVGFPDADVNAEVRESRQIKGFVTPLSAAKRDQWVIQIDGGPPSSGSGSAWAGMSGAAVFNYSGQLIGIVEADTAPHHPERMELRALPARAFVKEPQFTDWVKWCNGLTKIRKRRNNKRGNKKLLLTVAVGGSILITATLVAYVQNRLSTHVVNSPPVSRCPTVSLPVSPASSVARDRVGHVVVLARSQDSVSRSFQNNFDGVHPPWSDWADLHLSVVGEPVVVFSDQQEQSDQQDKPAEAFAIDMNGALQEYPDATSGLPVERWQPVPTNGAHLVGTPAVAQDCQGKLVVVARDADGSLWEAYQTTPGRDWNGPGLHKLPAASVATDPAVSLNEQGKLEVFAGSTRRSAVLAYEQTNPGVDQWGNATDLPGVAMGPPPASSPVVARDAQGYLEVFVVDKGGVLQKNAETQPGTNQWSGWQPLPFGVQLVGKPVAVLDDQNPPSLTISAVDSKGEMLHIWQDDNNRSWGPWEDLGSPDIGLNSLVGGALDTYNTMVVLGIGNDGSMRQNFRDKTQNASQDQGWVGWGNLELPTFPYGTAFSTAPR